MYVLCIIVYITIKWTCEWLSHECAVCARASAYLKRNKHYDDAAEDRSSVNYAQLSLRYI